MPLPQSEDPFDDDLGYGAAIFIVSVKPRHRITWGILKGITQGLWNFLVEEGRYMVCELGEIPSWLVLCYESMSPLLESSISSSRFSLCS